MTAMRDISAAVIQLRAGPDIGRCIAAAVSRCREAVDAGAEIIVLPENYWGITSTETKATIAVDLDNAANSPLLGPFLALSRLAPRAWILLGGLPERPSASDGAADAGLLYNSLVTVHRGQVVARYRKIHRFDADLPSGVVLRESATTAAGQRPVVLQTPAAAIGLSICYDLRFPSLYGALVEAGAEVIVAPSAFTLETGVDHWQVLVRARALDTQCYVLAPGLCGQHNEQRHSFGHSMIVDPWGTVIAHAPRGQAVLYARLSREYLDQIRRELPILRHQVLSQGPAADRIDLRGLT